MAQVRGINFQQRGDLQKVVDNKPLNSYSYLCSGQAIIPKQSEQNTVPSP